MERIFQFNSVDENQINNLMGKLSKNFLNKIFLPK